MATCIIPLTLASTEMKGVDMLHCSLNSVVCKSVLVVDSSAPVIFTTEDPTQSTGLQQDTVITLYLCRTCVVQDRGGG